MKKCPFCAEEIQDEAIFCRYCNRKVKGLLFRRILKIAVILAFAILLVMNLKELKMLAKDFSNFCVSIKNSLSEVQKGLTAFKDFYTEAGK